MESASLRILPANEAPWEDLAAVFGTRGGGSRCFCQRYKLGRGESFSGFPAEERAARLREQTGCDDPGAERTAGLIAYEQDVPIGWCAVEPRPAYAGLIRVITVPWVGREEDKTDVSVWAVTCLFVRARYRKQGVSGVLARAAVEFARDRGARALEAYPINTTNVIAEELHVGTVRTFADAGLREVSAPTKRRVVMRVDFG